MSDTTQRPNGALLAMRADVATARVFAHLRDAGIPALILKGPAIDRWLYGAGRRRTYGDVDVLVPPDHFSAACAEMAAMGLLLSEFPSPSRHAEHYDPPPGSALTAVDVHRTFHHVAVPDARCWELLSHGAQELELAAGTVLVPAAPQRAVIVALHLAEHGHPAEQQLMDVERAVASASGDEWRRAGELAGELGALEQFAAAVRSVAGGSSLADRLGWPSTVSPRLALSLAGGPPTSRGALAWLDTRGFGAKVRFLWRELVPPPIQMREHHPLARTGTAGLAAAYVARPAWLVRHAPAGLRAARQAQRVSRS